MPVTGSTTDLVFGRNGALSFTSTNDLAGPFQVNSLAFEGNAASIVVDGSPIEFLTDTVPEPDDVAPTIGHSGSGAITIKNDLILSGRVVVNNNGTGVVSLDGMISGGMESAQSYLAFSSGTWRITNSNNTYVGGTLVRMGAVLELTNAVQSQDGLVLDRITSSLLGNAKAPAVGQPENSNRLTLNAGTLRLTTKGTEGIVLGTSRTIYFGMNGGTVEMINSNLDDPAFGGGHIESDLESGSESGSFAPVLANSLTAPAIFKFNGGQFGLSDTANPGGGVWRAEMNVLRFSGFAAAGSGQFGPLRVELTNGAMVRAGTGVANLGGETVAVPFTVRGIVGGDPTSGADGTVNSGITLNTGRVVLEGSAEVTYSDSFVFQGALQVAPVARSRSLNGKLIVAGANSGFPGYVSFSGRSATTSLLDIVNAPGIDTAGQNVLWLLRNGSASNTPGDSPNQTLTIEGGGIAVFDPHVRSDASGTSGTNGNGIALDGLAVLKPGAELRISQSLSNHTPIAGQFVRNTGDIIIYGDIRGEGTTAKESVLNIYLPEPRSGATADSTIPYTFTSEVGPLRPYGGLRFDDSRGLADLIVNGSEFGGLKITASPRPSALLDPMIALSDPVTAIEKIVPVVSATRLARLTGTGGYLTVATPGQTWPFPAGGEWAAAVPVGLKVTDHNALGPDVSFAAISAFTHSIVLDGGTLQVGTAPLLFGPASAVNGLGQLQGSGTISGPMTLAGGANVSPGFGLGVINTNDLRFMNGSKLTLDIQGLTPGSGFDQLQVAGSLTLEGSVSIDVALGFNPVDFIDSFVIIQNDANDFVQGTGLFRAGSVSLPEGALFTVPYPGGTQTLKLSYVGGDGNDVELRAMPEPGTALLAVAGLGGLLCRRKRRGL